MGGLQRDKGCSYVNASMVFVDLAHPRVCMRHLHTHTYIHTHTHTCWRTLTNTHTLARQGFRMDLVLPANSRVSVVLYKLGVEAARRLSTQALSLSKQTP